jgi:DNA topoisomerase VI subunit B
MPHRIEFSRTPDEPGNPEIPSPSSNAAVSQFTWKTAVITALITTIFGAVGGGGVVYTNAVKASAASSPQVISEVLEQKFVTHDEYDRKVEERDKQIGQLARQDVMDERSRAIMDKLDLLRQDLKETKELQQRILQNQNSR